MPPKTVIQLPVTVEHLTSVTMSSVGTGLDVVATYQPVDDKGEPVGQGRSYTAHYEGAPAKAVGTFVSSVVLSEINKLEGT